jgi:hypothetical protein
MKIECRQQKRSKKKPVSSNYYLTPRLLVAGQMTLVTIGLIILTYLIAISLTDKNNSQASAAQINEYKFSSELANKRQLIVALQSIRMHNVTRYQRKTKKNLEQPPLSLSKANDTADDLSRISSVPILNRNNANSSAYFAASVKPVQQGW